MELGACLMHRIESKAGLISSYVHTSPATGLGRMAALVALETSTASLTEDQQSEAKVYSNIAYAVSQQNSANSYLDRTCMCSAWPNYKAPHQTSPGRGTLSCMQQAIICVWHLPVNQH
jgi:hypothetical protein